MEKLVEPRIEFIQKLFPGRKGEYICNVLTEDELFVIESTPSLNSEDILILARAKRFYEKKWLHEEYNRLEILDRHHYNSNQIPWMKRGAELVKEKVGHEPTPHELYLDYEEHHNGIRFRYFYAKKFPDKVRFR